MERAQNRTDAYGRLSEPLSVEEQDIQAQNCRRRSAYEKYFAGYEIDRELIGNRGKRKTVRKYTGTLYRQSLPDQKAKKMRILYVVAAILSVAALFTALFLETYTNKSWAMLGALLSLFAYGYFFVAFFTYFGAGRNLKQFSYLYGAKPLPLRSRLAFCSEILSIGLSVVVCLVEPEKWSKTEIIRMLLLAISGVLIYLIGYRESKTSYTEVA